jgi:hypothetical protein
MGKLSEQLPPNQSHSKEAAASYGGDLSKSQSRLYGSSQFPSSLVGLEDYYYDEEYYYHEDDSDLLKMKEAFINSALGTNRRMNKNSQRQGLVSNPQSRSALTAGTATAAAATDTGISASGFGTEMTGIHSVGSFGLKKKLMMMQQKLKQQNNILRRRQQGVTAASGTGLSASGLGVTSLGGGGASGFGAEVLGGGIAGGGTRRNAARRKSQGFRGGGGLMAANGLGSGLSSTGASGFPIERSSGSGHRGHGGGGGGGRGGGYGGGPPVVVLKRKKPKEGDGIFSELFDDLFGDFETFALLLGAAALAAGIFLAVIVRLNGRRRRKRSLVQGGSSLGEEDEDGDSIFSTVEGLMSTIYGG